MTDKEKYIEFCEKHPEIPLFQQAWWQACVAGERAWNVILIEENQEIVAFMPYMLVKKLWFRMILQPLLSQCNGIWIKDGLPNAQVETIVERVYQKVEELNVAWFQQFFPKNFKILSPFEKNGYECISRRTFVLLDLQREESELFKSFSSAKQRQIRKAQRNGIVVREGAMAAKSFLYFHDFCLSQKGERNMNRQSVELTLCREAVKRGQGTILWAVNEEDKAQATLFLVWDRRSAYYLIPTYRQDGKTTGASSLLVWEAIRYARNLGLQVFDFEGGNQENIARSYAQFGTTSVEYPMVERMNSGVLRVGRRVLQSIHRTYKK